MFIKTKIEGCLELQRGQVIISKIENVNNKIIWNARFVT